MDFGDILEKWERGQSGGKPSSSEKLRLSRSQPSGRQSSGGSPSSKTSPARSSKNTASNIMEEWLSNHEVYDKDADEQKTPAPGEQRRRLLHTQPDAVLDIHGLTGDKAWLTLDDFFSMARDNGYKKLRIIHGKGNRSQGEAVLGRTVRAFIEQCPLAGESGYEKSANGGSGATWVLLKD